MRFVEPLWLLALPLAIWLWLAARRRPSLNWSSLTLFPRKRGAAADRWLVWLTTGTQAAAISAIVLALARPQVAEGTIRVATRGAAIIAALDRSSSMSQRQNSSTRFAEARQAITRFADGRSDDLIGLVVFANYPDLICPPTLNRAFLKEAIDEIRLASPLEDGTNLGDAIAWSLESLRQTQTKSKVIILITDGVNSPAVPNPLDPQEAAKLANDLGATVHAIAIGGAGGPGDPGADLEALRRIAAQGGGQAFAASDLNSLNQIFQEIDQLEKSSIQGSIRVQWSDRHQILLAIAIAMLAIERLTAWTKRPIP